MSTQKEKIEQTKIEIMEKKKKLLEQKEKALKKAEMIELIDDLAYLGLWIGLVAYAYFKGRSQAEDNAIYKFKERAINEQQSNYSNNRSDIEKQIDAILDERDKQKAINTFNFRDLVVVSGHEFKNDCNDSFIMYPIGDGIYREYRGLFKAVNDRVVSYRENRKGSEYIHFLNSKALSSYFLEEEPMNSSIVKSVIKNNGKITLSELNQLESKMNESSKRKNRKAKTLKY